MVPWRVVGVRLPPLDALGLDDGFFYWNDLEGDVCFFPRRMEKTKSLKKASWSRSMIRLIVMMFSSFLQYVQFMLMKGASVVIGDSSSKWWGVVNQVRWELLRPDLLGICSMKIRWGWWRDFFWREQLSRNKWTKARVSKDWLEKFHKWP